MASTIRAEWLPGDGTVKRLSVELGGRQHGECQENPWVIVACAHDTLQAPPEEWFALVELQDGLGAIGPIHLPFTLHCPGVRNIEVRPATAVREAQRVRATVYPTERRGYSHLATYSFAAVAGPGLIDLPQWVRAIGSYDPAQFRFVDRTGADITADLDGSSDRPAVAVAVRCTADGILIFYY